MHDVLSHFFRWLLDAFFPISCAVCGVEGVALCDACISEISIYRQAGCPFCSRAGSAFHACPACTDAPLRGLVTVVPYGNVAVRSCIRGLKFLHREVFLPSLLRIVRKGLAAFGSNLPRGASVLVVPIPPNPRRLRERGFDHVAWIAEEVSRFLGVPFACSLRVFRSRPQQSRMVHDEERQMNARGAFVVEGDVSRKIILLVDDVYTTGATMREAARVLRVAGASAVFGFALARGGSRIKK